MPFTVADGLADESSQKQVEFDEKFFIPPRLKSAQKFIQTQTEIDITHIKLSRKAFIPAPLSRKHSGRPADQSLKKADFKSTELKRLTKAIPKRNTLSMSLSRAHFSSTAHIPAVAKGSLSLSRTKSQPKYRIARIHQHVRKPSDANCMMPGKEEQEENCSSSQSAATRFVQSDITIVATKKSKKYNANSSKSFAGQIAPTPLTIDSQV